MQVQSAPVAQAHETTRSLVTATRDGAAITTHLRIGFRDIEVVVWIDEILDGAITWAVATRCLDAVTAYVTIGLLAHAGGA